MVLLGQMTFKELSGMNSKSNAKMNGQINYIFFYLNMLRR